MNEERVQQSREIMEKAIVEYDPYAIVCMVSGGKDSLCAYYVAKELEVPVTHILHGITGTGIPETKDFVRQFASQKPHVYIEADAGDAYEEYVRRKGFFGRGVQAHAFAYHVLKHRRFVTCVSQNIRHRKRGRNILLINGARVFESVNRSRNLTEPIRPDPSLKSNIWVNIIHDWSREERDDYLDDVGCDINPVAKLLCRSGECMCGTMQSQEQRQEASFFFPSWGRWLDSLEAEVKDVFGWGWGDSMPKPVSKSQMELFQPMCVDCGSEREDT